MTIDRKISNDDYHGGPGISSTGLKFALISDGKRVFERDHPKDSDAFRGGTAVHSAVLTPDRFDAEVAPEIDAKAIGALSSQDQAKDWLRAHNAKVLETGEGVKLKIGGKDAEEIYKRVADAGGPLSVSSMKAGHAALHAGKTLVPARIYNEAIEISRTLRDPVHGHPTTAALFAHGEPEVSIWVDHVERVDVGEGRPVKVPMQLKSRMDWWDPEFRIRIDGMEPKRLIVDLKTALDASPRGFGKAASNNGYYVSAAHYIEVAARETGTDPSEWLFVWIAVEKSIDRGGWRLPFAHRLQSIYTCYATHDQIETGTRMCRRALQTIAHAKLYPDYPLEAGFPVEIQPAQLSSWIHHV